MLIFTNDVMIQLALKSQQRYYFILIKQTKPVNNLSHLFIIGSNRRISQEMQIDLLVAEKGISCERNVNFIHRKIVFRKIAK